MKKQHPLDETLAALRSLPLEVSMGQVRQWVRQYQPPATDGPSQRRWWQWFQDYFFSNN